MGNIKKLPAEIINQIAAGEVVERPASVVKELVENSLDAGADSIEIELKNGGINLIKVSDNGLGMSEYDAELSIAQHATSKISRIEDLFSINYFGFRGEALASISSVSKFTLQTKQQNSISGTQVTNINQKIQKTKTACPSGTIVMIEDLFFNIPARKKYLKTANTEYNHILNTFINFALIHGKVGWKLIHNGKIIYHLPKAAKWLDRIELLMGESVARNLLGVKMNLVDVEIIGFIGKPQIASKYRQNQYLYINKRPVSEYIISKSVKDAYHTLIPRDYYPVFTLNLKMDPNKIDVNVHPRKLEVRFSEPQTVYRSVYRAVSATLDKNNLVKTVQTPIEENKAKTLTEKTGFSAIKSEINLKQKSFKNPGANTVKKAVDFNHSMYALPKSAKKFMDQKIDVKYEADSKINLKPIKFQHEKIELVEEKNEWKIIGQIKNSYIIAETEDGIKIIDQHAASERIQFEKIKKQFESDGLKSQSLLMPQIIEVSLPQMSKIQNQNEILNKLGFSIDIFGERTVKIDAVPAILKEQNIRKVFWEILNELEGQIALDVICEPIRKILNIMSCRSAVKFGDDLCLDEMKALIDQLCSLENQYTCVHGRPAVIDMDYQELEKLFSRK